MSETKSFRKPYNPPIKATWWTKNPFYIRYMVREGTAVCALFVALELILGIFLYMREEGRIIDAQTKKSAKSPIPPVAPKPLNIR